MIVFAFAVAAAVGTLARWAVTARLPRPAGTLTVNLLGAGLLGWLNGAGEASHTVLGVAALGSLTTFSTLLVELLELWRHRPTLAIVYGSVSLVGGVGLAWIGLRLG